MLLGIIYKNGQIINHRSLIKVIFNPILRFFGFQIGTVYSIENNQIGGIKLARCKRNKIIKWQKYNIDYDYVEKRRMLI